MVIARDARRLLIRGLLPEIENGAEGCRDLARGGRPEALRKHWATLQQACARLGKLLSAETE